jgi:hypothetical protein
MSRVCKERNPLRWSKLDFRQADNNLRGSVAHFLCAVSCEVQRHAVAEVTVGERCNQNGVLEVAATVSGARG